jgi:hypothetical protein
VLVGHDTLGFLQAGRDRPFQYDPIDGDGALLQGDGSPDRASDHHKGTAYQWPDAGPKAPTARRGGGAAVADRPAA